MGIAVLGPLAIDGDGASLAPRDRVVLAALAVRPGEVASAEKLADALWGERPPVSWTKVVSGCIMRLRKVLGADAIETTPHGYRLTLPVDEVDAQRFERLVRRGRELLTFGEPERAAYVLGEALALWQGRALVDLEDWEPGRIEAERLDELRLDAEEFRLEASLRAGQHREVLGEAQTRVAEAPLRERRWALLALAQYQAGRQGEALRTLHRTRTVLAAELGLDPGPDLVALEQAILRQDPSLVADTALPEPSATCPYLGLVPYDVGDVDAFFGRDAEVAASLRSLGAAGVLAVVGPSGSGKSSLVRAGVAATLQRDGRRVIVVTPGARPLDALTAVPASAPSPVLVVDQCEEAVTLCDDADEQAQFFAALTAHAERGPLVVALRADRLGALSAHPGFARLVERNLHLLSAMSEADLRAAIEGPAHQAGLRLEPGLVDLLVHEVEGEPGALPLLSHALRQTWERREGRTLTVAGYRETGGIRGAVAQSAEQVYGLVSREQQSQLRDLLLRLVSTTTDGEPVRSRVPRRVVGGDAEHEQLIELLVGARLLTSDDGVVELAHESLARAWPRLRAWLEDDVDGQRIMRHLTIAADTWEAMGRPDSELYRGVRLAQAREWRERAAPDLNAAERDFLDASEQLAHAELQTAEDRARQQSRINRRLRVLLGGVAVLLAAAVGAGLLAWRQADRADEQANAAAQSAIAADARRVGAQALVAEDIDRSLLLAVEGARLDNSADTRANLLAALTKSPQLIRSARSEQPLVAVAVSPDGELVAVGDPFDGVQFHDAGTWELLGTLDEAPRLLEFRPDGEQIAVVANDFTLYGDIEFDPLPVQLVDTTTFALDPVQLGGLPEADSVARDVSYSVDGRLLAASFALFEGGDVEVPSSFGVMVWDLAVPEQPIFQTHLPVAGVEAVSPDIALSPDGGLVYVGTFEPPSVSVYEVATGRLVRSSDVSGGLIELSSDGTVLATVCCTGEVAVLDAATLTETHRMRGHTEFIIDLQFSHDGAVLASSSDDHTTIVWDAATGERREHLQGHAGGVWALAFSPDDATLYTVGLDRAVLTWDLRGDRRLMRRAALVEPAVPSGLAITTPDGQAVAYFSDTDDAGDFGATLQFLDVTEGNLGPPIPTGHNNWGPSWRPPDWDQLATTGSDGFVRVWDRRTGELVNERHVGLGSVGGLAYTADGTRLLVGAHAGAVQPLDAETLAPTGERVQLGREISDLFAGPDNRTAFVHSPDGSYAVVDHVDGRVLNDGELGFEPIFADFSPDGRSVAVVAGKGEVGVLDIDTGDWVSPPRVGHKETAVRVAYASDGSTFVSSGFDGRVSLWDGRTGELLASVLPGRPNVRAFVEFLADGHTVLISTTDGVVFRWDTGLDHWVEFACQVAGRNLTADEWRDAFSDRPYQETCPD